MSNVVQISAWFLSISKKPSKTSIETAYGPHCEIELIICIIRATYEGAKCRVLHKNKPSEPFEVRSGVRQGCILSAVLFLIVLGDVLREALKLHQVLGIRWTMTICLQHLDYANNICIFAHKRQNSPPWLSLLSLWRLLLALQ